MLAAFLIASAAGSTLQEDGGNWNAYNRTLTGERYSPLKEIDAQNVRRLRRVATFDTGVMSSFQTSPVVVDGTMFLTTYKHTYAIDAATGKLKWKLVGPST